MTILAVVTLVYSTGIAWSQQQPLPSPSTAPTQLVHPPMQTEDETEFLDKTLSPYFFIPGGDQSVDQLPLQSTSASVQIVGVIADVIVTQVYKNDGRRPIEAVYVFPGSTRAAVYAMKMVIGERTLVAEIQKREEARQTYEQAKQEGKTASLLEQQRPNVFQMNVANIMPGDIIRTELRYTELLVPIAGIYEFIYPTVVGPRYSNLPGSSAPLGEKWIANPYLHEGEKPPYGFDLSVGLSAGLPIQDIASPSHKVEISYEDTSRARIKLSEAEKSGGDRDFILRYRLTGSQIETGLILYPGEKENFFLLMMQPPRRIAPSQILPREYIFIVDVSGSMHGFPLEVSKTLLRDLIANLKPTDTFNVLLFAGGSTLMAPQSVAATPDHLQEALYLIDRQQGGGGTELLPALRRALALPLREGFARTVIIATDGYVAVEKEAFDLIRREIGNANFFTFGIGSAVNRFLIEGMARAGAGEPFVVTKPGEARKKAEDFRNYIQSPVLTQIKITYDGFDAYDVEPESLPDIFAERPVVVVGKWRGPAAGKITLTGLSGEGRYSKTINVSDYHGTDPNSALRYLWARHRIARLSDDIQLQQNDERISQVTSLGLQYHLLTAYTSFVAVDRIVRNQTGEVITVQQPLPLPQGVSDYAVGNAFSAFPMASPASPRSLPMKRTENFKETLETKTGGGKKAAGDLGQTDVMRQKVVLVQVSVVGEFNENEVREMLENRLAELDQCFPQRIPMGAGWKIRLRWTIDGSGRLSELKLLSFPKSRPDVARCFVNAIQKWLFEEAAGSGKTTVTATFLLRG